TLRVHAEDASLRDGDVGEQREPGHAVVALRVVRTHRALVAEVHAPGAPVHLTPVRIRSEALVEELRRVATGERDGEVAVVAHAALTLLNDALGGGGGELIRVAERAHASRQAGLLRRGHAS